MATVATPSCSDEPIKRAKNSNIGGAKDRTVIVIIPFGVVGSGKSTIMNSLKSMLEAKDQTEWTFDSVSSDEIRQQLMQPLIKAGQTKDQAF